VVAHSVAADRGHGCAEHVHGDGAGVAQQGTDWLAPVNCHPTWRLPRVRPFPTVLHTFFSNASQPLSRRLSSVPSITHVRLFYSFLPSITHVGPGGTRTVVVPCACRYWSCDELAACGLWGRKVTPAGDVWVVALVNTGNKSSHRITVPFTKLGWSETDGASVYDVWTAPPTPYPNATGSFEATVPVQGTVVVKIARSSSAMGMYITELN
jgi:hypothetical protein